MRTSLFITNDHLDAKNFCESQLRLVEILGSGAFGVVWRGVCGGKFVAIKVCDRGKHEKELNNEVDFVLKIFGETFFPCEQRRIAFFMLFSCAKLENNFIYKLAIFLFSAEILQNLTHASIVQFIGVGRAHTESQPTFSMQCMVMELMEDGSLKQSTLFIANVSYFA